MLLILTSEKDLTADFLIVELLRRQLPYFRLNTEVWERTAVGFSLGEDGVRRELSIGDRRVDLSAVHAVWYRRAVTPSASEGMSPDERAFVAGELRHVAMGLIWNPAITWVNPIDRVAIADYKLYQLQVARQVGLRVPRTLVSTDPVQLRDFARSNKHGTICKPVFHGLFVSREACYSVYTRRVTPDSFDPETVKLCPVLLQEEIPRVADVRATFIGPKCFVADIRSAAGVVDWRDPEHTIEYSASSLSTQCEMACRTMLGQLGLVYGAFDFVRTPDGELVFLEVNATGEWAWLEDRLGFPMREALIDLLYGNHQ